MFSMLPGYAADGGLSGIVSVNPLVRSSTPRGTLSTDLLTYTSDGSQAPPDEFAITETAFDSGLRYFEVTTLVISGHVDSGWGVGLLEVASTPQADGSAAYLHRKIWFNFGTYDDFYNDGTKAMSSPGLTFNTVGDVVGVVVDLDAGTLDYYRNGTHQFTATTTFNSGALYAACIFMYSLNNVSARFNGGDEAFVHFPSITGLVAWNDGL